MDLIDNNPLRPFLDADGWMVLDAGLATSLEALGADLDDPLWSAKTLLESPELIRRVHDEFLVAGADCITTSTYQATPEGFRRSGLSDTEGIAMFERSLQLALDARDDFWRDPANRVGRMKPLVAASVGPYGAFLADGSEYTGDYKLDEEELHAFHRRRWNILAAAGADLLACETIPSLPETRALLRLSEETPDVWVWVSVTCRDDAHLRDGARFAEVVSLCDKRRRVAAVGVNCTPARLIAPLIRIARENTRKPVFVYPNSGEVYDADRRTWGAATGDPDWTDAAGEWVRLGARAIGGCCRTGTDEIATLRRLATKLEA
jgi:homocysteine S-methyltransferase